MSRWYYIGGKSSFDGDMDFTEMAINFQTSDDERDAKVLYDYYVGKAEHYWLKLEETLSFQSLEEYREYHSSIPEYLAHKYEREISSVHSRLGKIKDDLDSIRKTYDKRLESVRIAYNKLPSAYSDPLRHDVDHDNNLGEKKHSFIMRIVDLFYYISNLLCGKKRSTFSRRVDYEGFPLPNGTGWFSYSSYMYALTYGIRILGVPDRVSDFDGDSGCSSSFMEHDFDHQDEISASHSKRYPFYYESVMKGDLTINQKEACIFTLWYGMHERNTKVEKINAGFAVKRGLNPILGMFGVKLNRSYWNEVIEIIERLDSEGKRGNVLDYIDGKLNNISEHDEDNINALIMYIYGASLIEKIK